MMHAKQTTKAGLAHVSLLQLILIAICARFALQKLCLFDTCSFTVDTYIELFSTKKGLSSRPASLQYTIMYLELLAIKQLHASGKSVTLITARREFPSFGQL